MFLPDQVKTQSSDPIPAGSLSPIYDTLGRIKSEDSALAASEPNFKPGDVVRGHVLYERPLPAYPDMPDPLPPAPLADQVSPEERAALTRGLCPYCSAPCSCHVDPGYRVGASLPLVIAGQGEYEQPYTLPAAPSGAPANKGLSLLEWIIFLGLAALGAGAVVLNFIGDKNALPKG